MKRQFVLDRLTNRLLEDLVANRSGSHNSVLREAIQLYARIESRLDEIETEPGFQIMMERSGEDIREGRLHSHAAVKRTLRRRTVGAK